MRISHLGTALLLATLGFTQISCARSHKYEAPRSEGTKVEAPFYITFSREGDPIVLDGEGNQVKPMGEVAKIPEPATIVRTSQVTVLEIRGSHYYLLYINGQYYLIPLG